MRTPGGLLSVLPAQPARLLVLLSVVPEEVRSPLATGFVCKLCVGGVCVEGGQPSSFQGPF